MANLACRAETANSPIRGEPATPQTAAAHALAGVRSLVHDQVVMVQAGYLTPFMRALPALGFTVVTSASESGGQFIAGGLAQATGRPTLFFSVNGPGAASPQGLYCCFVNRIPLVWVLGSVALGDEGTGAVQDASGKAGTVDMASVLRPMTVFLAVSENAAQLAGDLLGAVRAAKRALAPAVVIAPVDVQAKQAAVP